jgi:hypothetical protein
VAAALSAGPFRSRWIFDVELLARFVRLREHAPADSRPIAVIYEQPLASWHDVPGSKLDLASKLRALVELADILWGYFLPWSPAVTGQSTAATTTTTTTTATTTTRRAAATATTMTTVPPDNNGDNSTVNPSSVGAPALVALALCALSAVVVPTAAITACVVAARRKAKQD